MRKFAILIGVLILFSCGKTPEDVPNPDVISTENMFRREDYTRDRLSETYTKLYVFLKQLLDIEGRICEGNLTDLSPNAKAIKSLWLYANDVIRNCAEALHYIPISTPPNSDFYICQFSAIQGIMAYQVAIIWGKYIPITSIISYDTPIEEVLSSSQLLSIASSDFLKAEKMNGNVLQGQINKAAIYTFSALVGLTHGNKTEAKSYLEKAEKQFADGGTDFSVLKPVNYLNSDLGFNLPATINVITSSMVILLKDEATNNTEKLVSDWHDSGPQFGFWDMLVRTNKAKDVTGCNNHQLLFPVPAEYVDDSINLTQNPGY